MRLTVHTDYSLRLLIYLAVRLDELATVDDIAVAYGISRDHIAKVAHRLGRENYIETVRGRAGGLRLARPASEISVGEVVQRVEPDFGLVPCMGPHGAPCQILPCCVLRDALQRARDAFLETLNTYNLADLVRPRARLAMALGVQRPSHRRTVAGPTGGAD